MGLLIEIAFVLSAAGFGWFMWLGLEKNQESPFIFGSLGILLVLIAIIDYKGIF